MKLKSSNLLPDKCIEKSQFNGSELHSFLINHTLTEVLEKLYLSKLFEMKSRIAF